MDRSEDSGGPHDDMEAYLYLGWHGGHPEEVVKVLILTSMFMFTSQTAWWEDNTGSISVLPTV